MTENKYRAFNGWVEKTFRGGEEHQAGIDAYIYTQHGGKKSLDKALEEAKNVGGWVEEDGFPAHIPNGVIKIKK